MKILKMLSVALLVAAVVVLGVSQFRIMKELDKYKRGLLHSYQQSSETQMMMQMFFDMAPAEMERISRQVIREELGRPSEPDDHNITLSD